MNNSFTRSDDTLCGSNGISDLSIESPKELSLSDSSCPFQHRLTAVVKIQLRLTCHLDLKISDIKMSTPQ